MSQYKVELVYTDPEADYAFLSYDSSSVLDFEPTSLILKPDVAEVGMLVAAVGSAKGEEYTVNQGVISRLDKGPTNDDSNIYYIQISGSLGPGASGSPIVTPAGDVVALLCQGWDDATVTYGITLHSAERVLGYLQNGANVARGTMLTTWIPKTFYECRQLHLSSAWEVALHQHTSKDLLVADEVIRGGPADGRILTGDILLKLDGNMITSLVDLVRTLDNQIDDTVDLLLHRAGKEFHTQVRIANFADLKASCIVTVSGAVFHDVTYRQSWKHSIPLEGVVLSQAGNAFRHCGIPSNVLIDSINNERLSGTQDLITCILRVPNKRFVEVAYRSLKDLHRREIAFVRLDLYWYPEAKTYRWDERCWSSERLSMRAEREPSRTLFTKLLLHYDISDPIAREALKSLVKVHSYMPFDVDGYTHVDRKGLGVVLDARKGLVLVSRSVVPHRFCNIHIRIADSVEAEARLVQLDLVQGIAVVQYDTTLVQTTISAAEISISQLQPGAEVVFVGWNCDGTMISTTARVTDNSPFHLDRGKEPQYRPSFQSAVTVDSTMAIHCDSGILLDKQCKLRALWVSWKTGDQEARYAIPSSRFNMTIEAARAGSLLPRRALCLDTEAKTLADCRQMGLSDEWVDRVSDVHEGGGNLFKVRGVSKMGRETSSLREGDIVLTMNDQLVTRPGDFDMMYQHESLEACVWRHGKALSVTVLSEDPNRLETNQIIKVFGATIQAPHHGLREGENGPPSNVYIISVTKGSYADHAALEAKVFITGINGVLIDSIDDFLRVLKSADYSNGILLTIVSWNKLKTKLQYVMTDGYQVSSFPKFTAFIHNLTGFGCRVSRSPRSS